MSHPLRAAILAAISAVATARAQSEPWTLEMLEQRSQGFLHETWQARLEQLAQLLAAPESTPAMVQVLHGDHREYTAKIRGLLASLTHERWAERERAERNLIEVGSRARELLRERAQGAETLEERWRTQRILARIEERGTEDEDRRVKLMRGYALASLQLTASDALRRSLLSALGHTDSSVVNHSLRALGKLGSAAEVAGILRQTDPGSPHRLTALCALARLANGAGQAALTRLCDEGKLSDVELIHVLRVARSHGEVAWLTPKLAGKPVLAAAAATVTPAAQNALECSLTLVDRTVCKGAFQGFEGDAVVIANAVPGLARFEAPFAAVSSVVFAEPAKTSNEARVFLIQGSLLHGKLLSIDAEAVHLESAALGKLALPRAIVQGVVLAPDIDRLIGASDNGDRVKLADKSSRDGEVLRFAPDQGLILRADGKETTLPAAQVGALLLKRPPQQAPDLTQYTRLTLRNGDRLLGHVAASTPSHVGFVLPIEARGGTPTAVVGVDQIAVIELLVGGGASWGYTIIADYSENQIVEVDEKGEITLKLDEVFGAWDVECLDSGNLLITEFSVSRVQEISRVTGKPVWSFEDLKNPYDADRLPNGNTLIADTFGNRVIEVDKAGKVVWQYATDVRPFDCDRLPNGNTLIADGLQERVMEVNAEGQVVWEVKNLKLLHDADRLPNGNTLLTLRDAKKVVEIDRDGTVVFELKNLSHPSDADRLPNGNTLVSENGMVREFDRGGNEVWRKEMSWAVEANRY